MAAKPEPRPWERQPEESLKAFEAFTTYRDWGPNRSNAKVAQQLGKSKTQIDRWSSKWSWVVRVQAWLDHMDRQWLDSLAEMQLEARKRHLRLSQMVLGKFLERISNMEPEQIPATVLDRLFKVGVEAENTALGIPSHLKLELNIDDSEEVRQKVLAMAQSVSPEDESPE